MIRSKSVILIAGLIVIGFFIYAFNFNNPLLWDDDEWIKGNVFVHSFSYLKEIFTQNVEAGFGLNSNYYRPLLLLSFAFNYVIHGVAPFGYHLLSNGFHIVNGVLIFLLLSSFIGSRASFIASLLFLIHPAQTEAVAYISGRGDPMSVFFVLLALWLFVKSFQPKADPPRAENLEISKSRHIYIFLSAFSMILAILSRETAILFPLFLMVFYISFISKGSFFKSLKESFLKALPFFAVSVIYFILRLTVFNFENTLNFFSQSNIYTENLIYRLYTFGHALVEYFKIIFWPVGLHMERDLPVATLLFQWPVWLGFLVILGIISLVLKFYYLDIKNSFKIENLKLKIKEQNSNFRILFFGWAWFFMALGPVSGIIPINAIIYEHWLYLPLIGFATLAGFYIDKLLEFLKIKKGIISYWLFVIVLVVYFSFFAVQSIRRNILWGDSVKFYEDILKYSPSSVRILTNLGNIYYERGDFEEAEEFFKKAIDTPAGNAFAQPYYNLGNLYRDKGRIDDAITQYKKAIEVDPSFPFAYQNLATIYINNKRDLVKGMETLEQLKKIQPGNPRVYYNLGLVYLATGNNDLAIENLELGLELASGRDPEMEKAIAEVLSKIK